MPCHSLRYRDMSVEREIASFLDEYLYSQEDFTRKERTDSIEEQMKGSDIIISLPNENVFDAIVDEKGQTQYINNPLPTFSLELSFMSSKKKIIEGWLTDKTKKTEYYLFQWIHKADNKWNVKASEIKKLEYALVSRQQILDYFSSFGFNIEKLKEVDEYIRNNKEHGRLGYNQSKERKFWFYFSKNLAEQPINIIIRKEVLLTLAIKKGFIER